MKLVLSLLTACLLGMTPPPGQAADWLGSARDRLGFGPPAATEFLDPEIAFVVTAEAAAPDRVLTRWEVADGYYLYADKFGFSAPPPARVTAPVQPPVTAVEEDPYFGRVPITTGRFDIEVPLDGAAGRIVDLQLAYQGCAKDGICYPPIRKTVAVAMPAAAAGAPPAPGAGTAAGTPAAAPPASRADTIAGRLAGAGLGMVLASFFGFGLLLAFTPCVLPMVPILSGIIIGQGPQLTARWGLALSATYVLAMALVYAAAGVGAGLFGHNLQATFQHPAVLISFAAVFVLLAMAMFGAYELQLPSRWQGRLAALSNRQRAGTLGGVAIMGALSAVIVGPCVAPPLAGALLYIAASGDAVLGGLALFALALGMGAPLLAVGVSAGHWLPRAGAWMEAVRRVFGVLLLAVAVWLLERVLPGPAALALWGLLLVSAATLLGAFDALQPPLPGWRRLGKGAGIALAVWGAALLLGAAAGGSDPLRPLAPLAGGPGPIAHAGLAFTPVKGPDGLRAALARARGHPVMLDFYADWCIECKQLERTTFADPEVRAALSGVTLLQADVTDNDAEDRALLASLELFGPPAILFFDGEGRERRELRLVGYVGAGAFRAHLAALETTRVASR